jgi:hypothetical protein
VPAESAVRTGLKLQQARSSAARMTPTGAGERLAAEAVAGFEAAPEAKAIV